MTMDCLLVDFFLSSSLLLDKTLMVEMGQKLWYHEAKGCRIRDI